MLRLNLACVSSPTPLSVWHLPLSPLLAWHVGDVGLDVPASLVRFLVKQSPFFSEPEGEVVTQHTPDLTWHFFP